MLLKIIVSNRQLKSTSKNMTIRAPRFNFSFLVFSDFFYAVFCADSENVLKNVIRPTSGGGS